MNEAQKEATLILKHNYLLKFWNITVSRPVSQSVAGIKQSEETWL